MANVSTAGRQGRATPAASQRRGRRLRLCGLTLCTIVAGWAAAGPARAGEYVHYSCQTPDERSAPVEGWTRGMVWYTTGIRYEGPEPASTDTCADVDPPRRYLRADAPIIQSQVANFWRYTPPADTKLTRFIVSRYLTYAWNVRSGVYYDWRAFGVLAFPGPAWPSNAAESTFKGDIGDPASSLTAPKNLFDSGPMPGGISNVFVEAVCAGMPRTSHCDVTSPYFADVARPATVAQARMRMMQAFLADSSPPSVTMVAGTLAWNSVHSGVERVIFNATDAGGGVYRAGADVKLNGAGAWTPVARAIADTNGGKCVDAGVNPGTDYEFVHQVPCQRSVIEAQLDVDTTRLPPGNHSLRVYVEDAAGNRSWVIEDRPFSVVAKTGTTVLDKLPAPTGGSSAALVPTNGSRASARAVMRLSRTYRRVRFGSATTIAGRLVDEHDQGISGASIAVQEREYIPKTGLEGTDWKSAGNVATAAGGTFSARIPAGPSRAIRFIYRANPRQEGYTTSAEVRIAVRAGVRMRTVKSQVRNGSSAVFVGRVAGPIPRAGVLVTLQAYIPGRGWTPAQTSPATVRSRADGRFRLAYRFMRTFARTLYRFRVLVNEDSRFAYTRAGSRPVRVLVRP